MTSADKGGDSRELVETGDLSHAGDVGRGHPGRCAPSLWTWPTSGDSTFSPVPREPVGPGRDLLHVGNDGSPEGCDAEQPVGRRRWCRDGVDGCPRPGRPRRSTRFPWPTSTGRACSTPRCWRVRPWSWCRASTQPAVLAAIATHRATLMDGVPTAYYYLLAHPDFDGADLSSLTRCWVGGQTLPAAKAHEFTARTGCPIHEVWGMTELAGAASANPVVGPNKPGTIGDRLPGQRDAGRRHRRPHRRARRGRARRADVPRARW